VSATPLSVYDRSAMQLIDSLVDLSTATVTITAHDTTAGAALLYPRQVELTFAEFARLVGEYLDKPQRVSKPKKAA
jgi:hypothetical protein